MLARTVPPVLTASVCVVLVWGAPQQPPAPTPSPEVVSHIRDLCSIVKVADQFIYNALDMSYKPGRNKELLKKNLLDYNEALLSLRKLAFDHKEEVMKQARDILEEGLPKYFRVSFAEYKLQDKLDMTSAETDDIYVHRGKAVEIWTDLHTELGIPW